jgi:hypothetical protein
MNRKDKRYAKKNGWRRVWVKKETRDEWLKNLSELFISPDDLMLAGMKSYQEFEEREREKAGLA